MIATIENLRHRLKHSHLASRFLRGASWGLFGSVASQGITLVTMIFVARLLGKETYGQFILIQSTLTMFGTFAGFGIGATAIRYVAALKFSDKMRLGHILALCERTVFLFGLIITLAIGLLSQQLATNVLNSPSLTIPFTVAAATVFFSTLDGYQKSVLVGFESMRVYAISTIVGVIVSMPILFIAAKYYGIDGMAFALSASTLLQAAISRTTVIGELKRNNIVKNATGCLKEWTVLRDFALPALLGGAMITPAHWICQTMLVNSKNGFAEVAILGVAMQWFNAILFLPNIASKVVTPMLTEYVTTGSHESSKRVLVVSVVANLLFSLPVALSISAISPWILSAYGSGFENNTHILSIAVFTAVLVAVNAPIGNVLAAHSKMWTGLIMNLGWAASYIATSYIAIDNGAVGVVISMGIAYILHSGWQLLWTIKNHAIKP